MVKMELVYEGDLHCGVRHGPSGAEIATDAPVDNEGRGEAFSPTDLLCASLGSCMMTVMGIVARRHDWPLEGARVSIEKHMVVEPARRVGTVVVDFQMPAGIPEQARPVLERSARSCPVKLSLHPDLELDLRFRWGDVL